MAVLYVSYFDAVGSDVSDCSFQDYIFSLLTGYQDPPAGVELPENMNYNPYFPNGAIAMARVLFDGLVEYEDGIITWSLHPYLKISLCVIGTPATTSQMAKDVSTFLNWAAEPEHDERKKSGLKAVILFSALTVLSLYTKRFRWATIKTRKISKSSIKHPHHGSAELYTRLQSSCRQGALS
jgi:ubiquinol-cytochrome c reductase cytochrome c1 subunit